MAITYTEIEAITQDYFMAENKKAVDIVASKGFNVKRCMLNEAGYDNEKFDAVILNHILEH